MKIHTYKGIIRDAVIIIGLIALLFVLKYLHL
jgi:hypothetical protein